MSNWKCPFCGGNNLSTDRSCPGCGCLQSEAKPEPQELYFVWREPDVRCIGGEGEIGWGEAIVSLFAMVLAIVVYFITGNWVCIAGAILMLAVLIYVLLTMCTNSAD